jgi:hypothetical protein
MEEGIQDPPGAEISSQEDDPLSQCYRGVESGKNTAEGVPDNISSKDTVTNEEALTTMEMRASEDKLEKENQSMDVEEVAGSYEEMQTTLTQSNVQETLETSLGSQEGSGDFSTTRKDRNSEKRGGHIFPD